MFLDAASYGSNAEDRLGLEALTSHPIPSRNPNPLPEWRLLAFTKAEVIGGERGTRP
jgi:hypothetical protein